MCTSKIRVSWSSMTGSWGLWASEFAMLLWYPLTNHHTCCDWMKGHVPMRHVTKKIAHAHFFDTSTVFDIREWDMGYRVCGSRTVVMATIKWFTASLVNLWARASWEDNNAPSATDIKDRSSENLYYYSIDSTPWNCRPGTLHGVHHLE